MSKSFKDYLEESIRSYEYRIKIAAIDLTEDHIDGIEKLLSSYEIVEMSRPKKTIIQENPLDFFNLKNVDVSIIDIITHIPFVPFNIQIELKNVLGIPVDHIVIRNLNDPVEKETQKINDLKSLNDEADKKGLTKAPVLSIEPSSIESESGVDGKKLFGNEYNISLLKYLSNVAANRVDNEIKPESSLNPPKTTFDKASNYNDSIKDSIKPVPYWEKPDIDADMDISKNLGAYDNITDKINKTGKIVKDSAGKRTYITK